MRAITVLCDRVGDVGGAERYWETVLPALAARGARVRLLARELSGTPPVADARAIAWADENGAPSAAAARAVADELRRHPPDVVVTASVFDTAVLDAVRAHAPRWIARVHDHRAFCPTGDRVYPQFDATCTAAMGGACRGATLVRGCVHGPRPSSFHRIAQREALARPPRAGRRRAGVQRAHARDVRRERHRRRAHRDHAAAAAGRRVRAAAREAAARAHATFASRLTPRKGLALAARRARAAGAGRTAAARRRRHRRRRGTRRAGASRARRRRA